MLTDAELAELERLEKEATNGPWWLDDNYGSVFGGPDDNRENVGDTDFKGSNEALMLAARNALPSLIAELRAARARIAELERKETSVRRLTELAPKAFAEILGVELGAVHGAVATGGKTEGEP